LPVLVELAILAIPLLYIAITGMSILNQERIPISILRQRQGRRLSTQMITG
jgi:hypothetical protein